MSATTAPVTFDSTIAPRSRLRITRRGRAVMTTLAALPLVVGAVVFGLNGGPAAAGFGGAETAFETVTVTPGESLWSIAEEGAPSADPREVIAQIMNLNGLSTATIETGQQLALPLAY